MSEKRPASARTLKSNFVRMDAHKIRASEYKELPELNDEMFARAKVKKGGRPVLTNVLSLKCRRSDRSRK